ncbi:hypothetical protein C2S52_004081 [Perilla frutescens var. hirtella]|nr:hypothetical protein C2S52_004081 [Perilla frutescens var. hirtella]
MDSLPIHHDPLFATRRRGSTSQMCLHRILTTITTVPPPSAVNKCSAFDLNSPEPKESSSSTSSGGGGSDVDHEAAGDRARRNLSLLIEAAKLIFGEFVDGDESELKERNGFELKNDDDVAAEIGGGFQESPPSPALRSKRERTRVLPCRYRDSVLEPLTRFSRTGSSILPPKRRRR